MLSAVPFVALFFIDLLSVFRTIPIIGGELALAVCHVRLNTALCFASGMWRETEAHPRRWEIAAQFCLLLLDIVCLPMAVVLMVGCNSLRLFSALCGIVSNRVLVRSLVIVGRMRGAAGLISSNPRMVASRVHASIATSSSNSSNSSSSEQLSAVIIACLRYCFKTFWTAVYSCCTLTDRLAVDAARSLPSLLLGAICVLAGGYRGWAIYDDMKGAHLAPGTKREFARGHHRCICLHHFIGLVSIALFVHLVTC